MATKPPYDKLNRLAKWRTVFAGWQLGTRSNEDPECQAVRDHREATLLLRVEVTSLVRLLVEKGVFSVKEYEAVLGEEADDLSRALEGRFPGFRATDDGMSLDPEVAAETIKGWRP